MSWLIPQIQKCSLAAHAVSHEQVRGAFEGRDYDGVCETQIDICCLIVPALDVCCLAVIAVGLCLCPFACRDVKISIETMMDSSSWSSEIKFNYTA